MIKEQENVWATFKKQFNDVIEKQLTKKMKEPNQEFNEAVFDNP